MRILSMTGYKNNIAANILVLFMAAIYFLVASSHIFMLKNRTRADKKFHLHSNIITNKKIGVCYSKVDDVNFIKMVDKTTIENKKAFNDLIKFTTECFVITLFICGIWRLKPRLFNIRPSGKLINYQDNYLSICTLLI